MAHTSQHVPFAAGSETSHEAAIRAQKFVNRQGLVVYRWLRKRGGFGGTQREAAEYLGITRQSLCARFKALQDAGAIVCVKSMKRSGCCAYRVVGPVPSQPRLWG